MKKKTPQKITHHKVVVQQHLQVRVDAQRDDLRVERRRARGALAHVGRDGLAALERLDEAPGGAVVARDGRRKRDRVLHGGKVGAHAPQVRGLDAQVGLRRHRGRELR